MLRVQWREYKKYSGPLIKGTVPFELPLASAMHVDRAFWLTTAVETGAKFGAVIGYDGTGLTAGLDQHVAVYPKELSSEDYLADNDQGGLWRLLRRLEIVDGDAEFDRAITDLWVRFDAFGWYVARDGVLRYEEDGECELPGKRVAVKAGDPVFGHEIRAKLTPPDGRVPKSGEHWDVARATAGLLHTLLIQPAGFKAQLEFGIDHLIERTLVRRVRSGQGWVKVHELMGYEGRELTSLRVGAGGWTDELDLAMCFYQSNSVNAPSVANKALFQATEGDRTSFPRRLIQLLGNSSYGRWDDDLETGRYQRTRTEAMRSRQWSRSLFEGPGAIMPEDLPG